jgi:hypothetical protein
VSETGSIERVEDLPGSEGAVVRVNVYPAQNVRGVEAHPPQSQHQKTAGSYLGSDDCQEKDDQWGQRDM